MNVVDATETVGDLVTATAILANNTILLFQMLIARLDIDFLSRWIVGASLPPRSGYPSLSHQGSFSKVLYLAKELDEDDSILNIVEF